MVVNSFTCENILPGIAFCSIAFEIKWLYDHELCFVLQRHRIEEGYYITKEFLVTERNFIKDLEVIDKVS